MVVVPDVIAISSHLTEDAPSIIGKRAYTRSILKNLGLPTPPAFVITSAAFYHFLDYNNGLQKWRAIITNAQALSPESMVETSRQLQKLVNSHPFNPNLVNQIHTNYSQQLKNDWAHLTISPTLSTKAPVNFPLPIIKGETSLIDFLRQLWSAQLTPHALSLQLMAHQSLIEPSPIMVSLHQTALVSGTITTTEPTTGNKNAFLIEAIYGTNPQTDYRNIPPDRLIVDKTSSLILSRSYQTQTTALVADRFGHYVTKKIPPHQQFMPKLNQQQIDTLVAAANKIHSHQLAPQVINWLITPKGIFFTRFHPYEPHTPKRLQLHPIPVPSNHRLIAQGLIASPGIVTAPLVHFTPQKTPIIGKVVILSHPDINYLSSLRQASGIIIETGGLTSDIATIAREFGIPMLVGTGKINLPNDSVITLDAIKGRITINTAPPPTTPVVLSTPKPTPTPTKHATKIFLTLSKPQPHFNYVYQQAAGVGLFAANQIISAIGIHPKRLIHHQSTTFSTELTQKLTTASNLMGDRPVIYHPIDFPTDVAKKLAHGSTFEPNPEANTAFGFRGAFRAIHDPLVFTTEIKLLHHLRHKLNLKNIYLCLPLIRSATEFTAIKRLISTSKLHRSPTFKLFAKIGTPAATSFIPKLATEGLDGIFIDLDLLALSTLGYDPNSSEVDQELDVNHPAVINLLRQQINACDQARLPVFILSYKLSQSVELIDNVVNAGAHAIIVDPPQFDQVSQWLIQAEAGLVTNHSVTKLTT